MIDPQTSSDDHITIERHGELIIVIPSPALEEMDPGQIEEAAEVILAPLDGEVLPLVIIDLSKVDYFGSTFLSVLLRCWKKTQAKGGLMVLTGVSLRARELLRVTSLDMVWPIYGTRREAIDALLAD
jgi:anti-sigma B factor antagonist